jgi:S1-C subfamily serine protease
MFFRIIIFFVLATIFNSCGPTYNEQTHTVEEVLNGNRIKLTDGVQVTLIGVNDCDAAFEYLKAELKNKKITLKYDNTHPEIVRSSRANIFAYVFDENADKFYNQILLENFDTKSCSGNDQYLTDNKGNFKNIANKEWTPEPIYIERQSENNSNTSNTSNSGQSSFARGGSLRKLIKHAEPATFKLKAVSGYGTGFFINDEGLAISSYHVTGNNNIVWKIEMPNSSRQYDVEILERSKEYDFVIFRAKTNGEKVPYLKMSESVPQDGDKVLVIGNPQGQTSVKTTGIVSSSKIAKTSNLYKLLPVLKKTPDAYFQIDAAISGGSSGGPVINQEDGTVLGISTFKQTNLQGGNFALNIKVIQKAIDKQQIN